MNSFTDSMSVSSFQEDSGILLLIFEGQNGFGQCTQEEVFPNPTGPSN